MVVAVLYFAREIFIPISLAVLFAFLLAPLVTRLRRWGWWRVPSVLTVVAFAFVVMSVIGAVMAIQLTDLGRKMPEYQKNIHQKLQSLRDSSDGLTGRFTRLMHNFNQELKPSVPALPVAAGDQKPVPVEIRQGDISPFQLVPKVLGSVIGMLLTCLIVVVFVIFMLLQQEDLRDRVIRLVGWRQLNVTTKALDEAGDRVSRYLIAQLIVNVAFGIPAGVALYFLGVPNPILWGVLAALFRYIPYLGIWIAAIMPAAVIFAIDPGWEKPVAVFGIYGGIDILMSNFLEPLVYGNTTGLTPLAILLAAVFWAWLWGPVGLLLATPLTVCLAVLGRYVPSLRFLGVLLSDEEVLTPEKRFYQRLLAADVDEAGEVAAEFLKGKSLDELYDVVILPALALAEADCLAGRLDEEQQDFVFHNARLLVEDIAPRAHGIIAGENGSKHRLNGKTEPHLGDPVLEARVLSLPARGEADEIAALMLAQLLNARGIGTRPVSAHALSSERLEEANGNKIEVVCVSSIVPDDFIHARYLCKRLHDQYPELRIVAAILVRGEGGDIRKRELSASANEVAATLGEAVHQIQSLVSVPAQPAAQAAFQLVIMLLESEAVAALNDPLVSARAGGLRHVSDEKPGIKRERSGKNFRYRNAAGKLVHDAETLRRIKSLVIPPAWTDVWICPDANGHLQATGRDDRGRKQFRYHPRWREIRDETKYARMIAFARALPKIRRRLKKDIALPDLPRNKVLAAVVRLLEVSLIRVGNDEYARENDSFGLTTMRNKHVDVRGSKMQFHFRGKAGKWHDVDIQDRRLAKIVERCQDLPGQELFQFVDDDGGRHDVRSEDVNDYLREVSGQDFTAKDFRTWAGTVLASMALREFEKFDTKTQAKKNVVAAIEAVAAKLGNTPAVCKKCYIHPHVIDSYLDGTLIETLKQRTENALTKTLRGLPAQEAAVLGLLQQRLTLEARLAKAIKKETAARSRARKTISHSPASLRK